MTTDASGPSQRECRAFCRYLAGAEPSAYVTSCYEKLLSSADADERTRGALIERSLLAASSLGSLPLRMADGYARVFRPRSLLRRRLILLLAILENSPPTERALNSADEGSLFAVGARLAGTLVVSVMCTLAGTVVLGPVHVVSMLGSAE